MPQEKKLYYVRIMRDLRIVLDTEEGVSGG